MLLYTVPITALVALSARFSSISGQKVAWFWDWSAKWPWYSFWFGLWIAMLEPLQEYAVGLVCIVLSAFGLWSKLMHWQGRPSRLQRVVLKILGTCGILMLLGIACYITVDLRDDRPWSHLSKPFHEFVESHWSHTLSKWHQPHNGLLLLPKGWQAMGPFGAKPHPPLETGPDTRGYLRSDFGGSSFDFPHINVRRVTSNIGKLQVLPNAVIISILRLTDPLTEKQETDLFRVRNFGRGPALATDTFNNYWDPGYSKARDMKFSPEADTSDALVQAWENDVMKGGENIYVYTLHAFDDKLGRMFTESCFYLKGPDLGSPHDCLGHNGPVKRPPKMTSCGRFPCGKYTNCAIG